MYLPVEYVVTSSLLRWISSQRLRRWMIRSISWNDRWCCQIFAGRSESRTGYVSSGYISFGKSHQTLVVFADHRSVWWKTPISWLPLWKIWADCHLFNTESWRSLFCSATRNYTLRPRLSTLSSLNFAEMEVFIISFQEKKKEIPGGKNWYSSGVW